MPLQLTVDTGGNLYLTDLSTSHGTNVDGAWIRPNQARQLAKGAVFKLAASSREYKVWACRGLQRLPCCA